MSKSEIGITYTSVSSSSPIGQLSYRTNKHILAIKQYLNHPSFRISFKDGKVYHSFEIEAISRKEFERYIDMLLRNLYELYELDTNWRGEKLTDACGYWSTIEKPSGNATIREEKPGLWSVCIEFSKEKSINRQPIITGDTFSYDIEKLYAEKLERKYLR